MKRNAIVVGAWLMLFLSSCGPRTASDFAGGGAERSDKSGVLISQWEQQGEQFYVGVWHKDSNDPAFLLVARVPVKTDQWGLIFTTGYKFELADLAQKKSWAIYDVLPESSKELFVIADQSFDLKNGRVLLLDVSKADHNVVQIDTRIPDMRFPLDLRSTFAKLAEEHQRIKDFLHKNE